MDRYHGSITKPQCHELLLANFGHEVDGKFLLRQRPSNPSESIVSVIYKGKPTHHLVTVDEETGNLKVNKTILQPPARSLADVVDHLRIKRKYWPVPLTFGVVPEDVIPEPLETIRPVLIGGGHTNSAVTTDSPEDSKPTIQLIGPSPSSDVVISERPTQLTPPTLDISRQSYLDYPDSEPGTPSPQTNGAATTMWEEPTVTSKLSHVEEGHVAENSQDSSSNAAVGDVDVDITEFMHGPMSREEAGALILADPQDGAYLMRPSTKEEGVYFLAVSFRGKATHHQVATDADGNYLVNKKQFGECQTIGSLIRYLETPRDGWPVPLRKPVSPSSESPEAAALAFMKEQRSNGEEPGIAFLDECVPPSSNSVDTARATTPETHASSDDEGALQNDMNSMPTNLSVDSTVHVGTMYGNDLREANTVKARAGDGTDVQHTESVDIGEMYQGPTSPARQDSAAEPVQSPGAIPIVRSSSTESTSYSPVRSRTSQATVAVRAQAVGDGSVSHVEAVDVGEMYTNPLSRQTSANTVSAEPAPSSTAVSIVQSPSRPPEGDSPALSSPPRARTNTYNSAIKAQKAGDKGVKHAEDVDIGATYANPLRAAVSPSPSSSPSGATTVVRRPSAEVPPPQARESMHLGRRPSVRDMMAKMGSSPQNDTAKRGGVVVDEPNPRESMYIGKRPSVRDVAKAQAVESSVSAPSISRRGVVPTFDKPAESDEVRMSTLAFLLDGDATAEGEPLPELPHEPPTNDSGVPLKAVDVKRGATDQILELAARSSTESRRTAKYFDPAAGPRESMALGARPSVRDMHPVLEGLSDTSQRGSLRSSANSDSSL